MVIARDGPLADRGDSVGFCHWRALPGSHTHGGCFGVGADSAKTAGKKAVAATTRPCVPG